MNSTKILDALGERVLMLDGGMGSLLIAGGLEQGRAPEWWNLEHPDRVEAAHRQYVAAGSDIIQTNTFGGSPHKLATFGLEGRCDEVNQRAVEIARASCGPQTWVAGDIGPTGLMLPPVGTATEDALYAGFCEQARALAAAGADLIAVETMYDLREALAAVRGARATGLPVFASMTFEAKKRGAFTIMGDRLVPALQQLRDAGASAVGMNCSVTSDVMLGMAKEALASVEAPLILQPNAGAPQATREGIRYDVDPERFVGDMQQALAAGARVLGGCCGTDPSLLGRLRQAIDRFNAARATPS